MGVLLTFLAVVVAMVFFRAKSISDAAAMLRGMAGRNGFAAAGFAFGRVAETGHGLAPWLSHVWNSSAYQTLLLIPVLLLIVWTLPNTQELIGRYAGRRIPVEVRTAVYSVIVYLLVLRSAKPQSFMYFQF
jgi:hypothetical protein